MIPYTERCSMVEKDNTNLSVRKQTKLLGITRSTVYYLPRPVDDATVALMRMIDQEYTRHPFYGVRKIRQALRAAGVIVNHKRVARLMRRMGIQSIAPKPNLSVSCPENKVYPYLLRDVAITHVNQVWSSDITYIPMKHGFMYLTAVIDWHSRYVLSWELSNSLDNRFCVSALRAALKQGKPEIFNTDQGSQFTSNDYIDCLTDAHVHISMDGRGRALDNIFIERLWRSLKYELIYPNDFNNGIDLRQAIDEYFRFYNNERFHESLKYGTPAAVYMAPPSLKLAG